MKRMKMNRVISSLNFWRMRSTWNTYWCLLWRLRTRKNSFKRWNRRRFWRNVRLLLRILRGRRIWITSSRYIVIWRLSRIMWMPKRRCRRSRWLLLTLWRLLSLESRRISRDISRRRMCSKIKLKGLYLLSILSLIIEFSLSE